jgi:hypothetical protein
MRDWPAERAQPRVQGMAEVTACVTSCAALPWLTPAEAKSAGVRGLTLRVVGLKGGNGNGSSSICRR